MRALERILQISGARGRPAASHAPKLDLGAECGDAQEVMRATECFLQEFWGAVPPWSKPSSNETAIGISKTAGGVRAADPGT